MPKNRKKAEVPAEEAKLAAQIKAIADKGDKRTDQDKTHAKELRAKLGALKFVRVGNKRIPRILKAVESLGNFSGSGYSMNEAQKKAVLSALDASVKKVEARFGGKTSATGFQLPTTDESAS